MLTTTTSCLVAAALGAAVDQSQLAAIDVCHPLWLSRTPRAQAIGETLRHMRVLELRTLRLYRRPGKTTLSPERLSRIEGGFQGLCAMRALSPASGAVGARGLGCTASWRLRGRADMADVARLTDELILLQASIASGTRRGRVMECHMEEILNLRGMLSDLRGRRSWAQLGCHERSELLSAFQLWSRLAADALDRTAAFVADADRGPASPEHALCAALAAYTAALVATSGESMLARAAEVMPRRRLFWRDEGSEAERRAADAAVAKARAATQRGAQAADEWRPALPDCDPLLKDRRIRAALRAIRAAQAQREQAP